MKRLLTLLFLAFTLSASAGSPIYKIKVKNADGKIVKMKAYKGKVLLMVNTATKCGFTPQYEELEALYEKYRASGFEILDFPCNQFGAQAPGTIAEIQEFCTSNYNVTFPQFDKIDVNGADESPLFTFLKKEKGFGGFDTNDQRGKFMHEMMLKKDADYQKSSDIKWNFTKFLVDRKGRVIRRFEPTDSMRDVEEWIEKTLK